MSCSSADCIASGDRGGSLAAWQLGAGRQHAWARASAHQGHITALASLEPGVQGTGVSLVSGGQDGCLRAWDCRYSCTLAVGTWILTNSWAVSLVSLGPEVCVCVCVCVCVRAFHAHGEGFLASC